MRGAWRLLLLLPFLCGCAGQRVLGREASRAAVGICFDAGTPAGDQLADQLEGQNVELVGCLRAKPGAEMMEWRQPVRPNGFWPAAPTPRRPADARFGYSFERGLLHLTVVETADPMTANSEAYLWLMNDLSLAKQPWKVVILSRPILSPSPVRVDRARADLADLLAQEGVALTISAGDPAYFRSARIGESAQDSVRYVLLGGDGAAATPASLPEWAVCVIGEPCFCVLDVNAIRLQWAAYNAQGRLGDLLEVPAAENPAGQELAREKAASQAAVAASPPIPTPAAAPSSDAKVFTWSEVTASEKTE